MKTKVIILTVLTFLLANDLSFAEKEQGTCVKNSLLEMIIV